MDLSDKLVTTSGEKESHDFSFYSGPRCCRQNVKKPTVGALQNYFTDFFPPRGGGNSFAQDKGRNWVAHLSALWNVRDLDPQKSSPRKAKSVFLHQIGQKMLLCAKLV